MTNNVSFKVQSRVIQRNIHTIQQNMVTKGNEVSTGKKENIVKDLGGETRSFLDLKSVHQSLLSRQQRLQTGDNRLAIAETAYSNITQYADDIKDLVGQIGIIDRNSIDVYVSQADATLEGIVGSLNVQWGGRYLFSGDAVLNRAIDSFDSLKVAVEDVITTHAANNGGNISSEAEIDALFAEIDTIFDNTHPTYTYNALSYQGGDSQAPGIEAADNDIIPLDIKADNDEIKQTIKGFMLLATADTLRGTLEETDQGSTTSIENYYLRESTNQILLGETQMIEKRSNIGFKQQRIKNTQEGLTDTILQYEIRIGLFENVDQYEVGIEFSELQRQLEISFYVTSQISQQSLLNYLR